MKSLEFHFFSLLLVQSCCESNDQWYLQNSIRDENNEPLRFHSNRQKQRSQTGQKNQRSADGHINRVNRKRGFVFIVFLRQRFQRDKCHNAVLVALNLQKDAQSNVS
eukprot:05252.XXX_184730_185050_1 [CDS] Oithona nana genome sequencing.